MTKSGYGGIIRIPKNIYRQAQELKIRDDTLKGISHPLHYYVGIVQAKLYREMLDDGDRKKGRGFIRI